MITLALAILVVGLLVVVTVIVRLFMDQDHRLCDLTEHHNDVVVAFNNLAAHVRRLEQREQPRTPSYEATKRAMEGTEN